MNNLGEQFIWFFGVIEDRGDPLRLGRVRVRCYGWHTDDKNELPTKDLPWSQPLQPTTSSGMSGFGSSSVGLLEGSLVVGFFIDGYDAQQPIIMGSIAGMPIKGPNTAKGFNDPNGLYPYKVNESDLNRLARNDLNKAHPLIKRKKDKRIKKIPVANSINTWNEPQYAYNAKYPYNHVYQSESGHIREIDDTVDNERIHEYHKSGTFYEIDSRGNRILKIEGDDYKIVMSDGNLYVDGNLNITVAKKLNIKCKELNIEVSDDVNKKYGGNEIEQIGGSVSQTIVGDEIKTVGGGVSQTIVGDEIKTVGGSVSQTIVGDEIKVVGGSVSQTISADESKVVGGSVSQGIVGNEEKTVGGNITINSVGNYDQQSLIINFNEFTPFPVTPPTPPDDPEAPDKVSPISVSSSDAELGNLSYSTPGGANNPLLVVNDRAADGSITTRVTNISAGPKNSNSGSVYGSMVDSVPLVAKAAADRGTDTDNNCNRKNLGSFSSSFESAGASTAIGFDEVGGFSYGLWQITTSDGEGGEGTFPVFMAFLKDEAPGIFKKLEAAGGVAAAREGTEVFKNVWKELGKEGSLDKDIFTGVQHLFIKRSHFDKTTALIKQNTKDKDIFTNGPLDICDDSHSPILQEVIFDTAVQHGEVAATRIVKQALESVYNDNPNLRGKTDGSIDSLLIAAIYNERMRNNGKSYFPSLARENPDRLSNVMNTLLAKQAKAGAEQLAFDLLKASAGAADLKNLLRKAFNEVSAGGITDAIGKVLDTLNVNSISKLNVTELKKAASGLNGILNGITTGSIISTSDLKNLADGFIKIAPNDAIKTLTNGIVNLGGAGGVSELSKIASTIGGLQNIGSITSNISGLVSSFNTLSSALSSRNIATTAKAFVKGALKRTITNVMKKIPKISFKF